MTVSETSCPISVFGEQLRPRVEIVEDALITAPRFDAATSTTIGAVYGPAGNLITSSLRPAALVTYWPGDPASINAKTFAAEEELDEAIFAGTFMYAWGHFLLETLTTAYAAALTPPNAPVIFVDLPPRPDDAYGDSFRRHVQPLLAEAWRGREIRLVRATTRVRKLHLVGRLAAFGMQESRELHPAAGEVFARLRGAFGRPREPGLRLVMQRRANHRRYTQTENDIYAALAKSDAQLIDMQALTAPEQIATISRAETIIGFSGSMLHNSMFAHPGATVVEISDSVKRRLPNRMQEDLAAICGHTHRFAHSRNEDLTLRPAAEVLAELGLP
ncbi:MAG: glycosyltransferase family 61 protein [Pseudomonadota bacterium]